MAENTDYKHADYSIRSADPYAFTKYKVIMSWLPDQPGMRVLNAGCGSGEMTMLLAQQSSWRVDAIDIDPEAIRLSQEIKGKLGLKNVTVSQASIEEYAGREYDLIISNDVLEHIENDSRAVQKLAALLKPGGILCVSVPAAQWLYGYHDEMLGHYRRYNKRLLASRLTDHFEIKRSRYFGATLIPIALLYSGILRRPYPVGHQRENSFADRVLKALLHIEQVIEFPIGTSLLTLAR